jgi:hypothetical protein
MPFTLAIGTNSDKDKVEMRCFAQDTIGLVWDELVPMLQRSVDASHGMMSVEVLRDWLREGVAAAFVTLRDGVPESVVVLNVVVYAHYRAARIIACGGERLDHAMRNFDMVKSWALLNNCQEIEGWVNPPLTRLTKKWGFRLRKHIISYNLREKLQ